MVAADGAMNDVTTAAVARDDCFAASTTGSVGTGVGPCVDSRCVTDLLRRRDIIVDEVTVVATPLTVVDDTNGLEKLTVLVAIDPEVVSGEVGIVVIMGDAATDVDGGAMTCCVALGNATSEVSVVIAAVCVACDAVVVVIAVVDDDDNDVTVTLPPRVPVVLVGTVNDVDEGIVVEVVAAGMKKAEQEAAAMESCGKVTANDGIHVAAPATAQLPLAVPSHMTVGSTYKRNSDDANEPSVHPIRLQ